MVRTDTVSLRCAYCGHQMTYQRASDPTLPDDVAVIVQPHCDWCWDGQEPEGEDWFDVNGNFICQDQYCF